MTLDDLERPLRSLFQDTCVIRGVPWGGASNDSGVVESAIFSTFARHFFRGFSGIRPTLLYSRPIVQSLSAFTLTPKYVTLSDRERSFYVKFCFVLSSSKFAFFLTR